MVSLVLALVLASIYGLVFYLIFGRGWARLFFYWLVSVAGFALGLWLASAVGFAIFNVGELNVF